MKADPIGIFDSGLGGLSVWKAIRAQLPNESLLYYADQARCPYGPRSPKEIQTYSEQITDFLLSQGSKMIVVACNTATAAAIQSLRAKYAVPFVGLEPALKPAVKASKSGKVGILATNGTFRGGHFQRTKARFGAGVDLSLQVGRGLVEAVEAGQINSPETRTLLEGYLLPMREQGVDQIVLGCTHYPFLREVMQEIVGPAVEIIDPAPAVARRVSQLLSEEGLQQEGPASADWFYSSGDPTRFTQQLSQLLKIQPPEILKTAFLSF